MALQNQEKSACVLWSRLFRISTVLWCVEALQMSSALWLWERPFTPSGDPRVRLVCPPLTLSKIFSLVSCTVCEVNVLQCVEDPWVVGTPLHTDRLLWPCVGGRGSSSRTNMPYTDPSADSQHSLNRPNWRNGCFLILRPKEGSWNSVDLFRICF